MKRNFLLSVVLLGLCNVASGAAGEPLELQYRYPHHYTTFVVNEDGTAVETRDWSLTVLKEAAVEWSKRASFSFSTSAQKAEVIAAYTKKADGSRIEVPKDNYQIEINRGKENRDSPVYSDITTMTVVFPNVAVGDTVGLSYRLIQTEPLFPGHFSAAQSLPAQTAFDDLRVRFDYPASLWVQFSARGMSEQEKSQKDDRKLIEWRYANPKPLKNERRNFSVFDPEKEPGYAFSTFKSYADIASAYGVRALPKAAVTERIQRLASEIVKDRSSSKEQARALYEWVATNITYAGNCIGIGAVVPRDLSFVLDNKMGDCKDHATLLQALLAARGIKSTQALVNAGSIYRLPSIPVVSTVNHVINYLPGFDLYVDSTSDSTPFGMLPFQVAGKPALLVEGYRDGVKTPVPPIGSNQQKSKSILKIAADGSISGTVEVTQRGEIAVQMRAWARKTTKEWEDDFVKNMFRAQGMIGSGVFEKEDPTALIDSFRYKVSLSTERFTKLPGAGAFYIYPLASSARSIHDFLTPSMETEKDVDVVCSSGSLTEEYVIELPKNMKVLSVPDDMKVANEFLAYQASYKLRGNVLTATRTMDDRTRGNICSPQVFLEYKKFGEKVMDNLKSQVLYK
jgi:transglutaminase-like putative cysteine protease